MQVALGITRQRGGVLASASSRLFSAAAELATVPEGETFLRFATPVPQTYSFSNTLGSIPDTKVIKAPGTPLKNCNPTVAVPILPGLFRTPTSSLVSMILRYSLRRLLGSQLVCTGALFVDRSPGCPAASGLRARQRLLPRLPQWVSGSTLAVAMRPIKPTALRIS
jgi:hypothetical protein